MTGIRDLEHRRLCGVEPAGRAALVHTGPRPPLCPDWPTRWSIDQAPASCTDRDTGEPIVCTGGLGDDAGDLVVVCSHECHGPRVLPVTIGGR